MRNPGTPLDLGLITRQTANRSAILRRTAQIGTRRSVKQEVQVGWLLRAITLMDLTTLAGDDTRANVERLCAKAKHPLRPDLEKALGADTLNIRTAAVCVYDTLIPIAKRALEGTGIDLAAVSTAFPSGLIPLEYRLKEIEHSVAAGASEIDVVIHRALVLEARWQELYDEVKAMRAACGTAHLKVILATGELATLRNIARASWVSMMAGADFIKTSTGKEATNATMEVSLVMTRAIREFHLQTGHKIGFKPAGGIRTAKQAIEWMILMAEELGTEWLNKSLFRFGASALLTDIERQLEFHATGRYSAAFRHPLP